MSIRKAAKRVRKISKELTKLARKGDKEEIVETRTRLREAALKLAASIPLQTSTPPSAG